MNDDTLQRFMFEKEDVRGELVHLNKSLQAILDQHQYPATISRILAQALVAAALLTSTIKFKGTLTIQFRGEGPLRMLVAKCNEQQY